MIILQDDWHSSGFNETHRRACAFHGHHLQCLETSSSWKPLCTCLNRRLTQSIWPLYTFVCSMVSHAASFRYLEPLCNCRWLQGLYLRQRDAIHTKESEIRISYIRYILVNTFVNIPLMSFSPKHLWLLDINPEEYVSLDLKTSILVMHGAKASEKADSVTRLILSFSTEGSAYSIPICTFQREKVSCVLSSQPSEKL